MEAGVRTSIHQDVTHMVCVFVIRTADEMTHRTETETITENIQGVCLSE